MTASFGNRIPRNRIWTLIRFDWGADTSAHERLGRSIILMRVEMRPAMPSALPRAAVSQARRERLLRWCALAVTVLTATIAVLAAAMAAVLLGMT